MAFVATRPAVVTAEPQGEDEGPPLGAISADEAAYLAGSSEDDEPPQAAPAPQGDGPLPALDTLVSRVPEAVREAMDDLLRARFVRVRRIPDACLKAASPGKAAPKGPPKGG